MWSKLDPVQIQIRYANFIMTPTVDMICVLYLLTILHVISLQITVPDTVSGRYSHSLSAVMMGPHHVWLVVVGGAVEREMRDVGGGVKQSLATYLSDPSQLTVVIELGKCT